MHTDKEQLGEDDKTKDAKKKKKAFGHGHQSGLPAAIEA